MTNVDARISLQRSRFTLIQEAADFNDEDVPSPNRQLINTRLALLEQNWNRFQEEHESLCLSESDGLSSQPYVTERLYERCQAFYVFSRAKLLTRQEELDSVSQPSGSTPAEQTTARPLLPRSALPRIKLPSFSGEYHSWRTFHDLFSSMIKHNTDLTEVEKMHYLKTCLTGEAAKLINNLSLAGDSFAVAWNLLVSRYENKRFLINIQLDRIMSLKPLKNKSANGLRTFLTTILEALGALRALDCSVHQWDPLLLHQFTRLLDSETREAWEVKLGSSPTFPTFAQFEEFLDGRTRALEILQPISVTGSKRDHPGSNSRRPHASIAAHSSTTPPPKGSGGCPLCGDSHYIAKCDRYRPKTLKQRRDIIIKHRRCFNCLGPHNVKNCKSTKRCLTCGKRHHTSLHEVKAETATKPPTDIKVTPSEQPATS
ncbi:PREDICTED: uncharacterized protein LOC105571258 [Vollenhovia emeryi]|uniref:uncharacterized protein LOC105571258 n=1 Tax=Vollenhovia emeryi TaxID=411798 RepID=UPI0005F3F485|nr:PREDICTED: uncharacterized protein LOC105571258 [Vollenhovia emeryi]